MKYLHHFCEFILLRIRHENGKVINVFIFFQYVKALYDFTPQEPGELEFRRGDIITGNNSIFYVQNSKVVCYFIISVLLFVQCAISESVHVITVVGNSA